MVLFFNLTSAFGLEVSMDSPAGQTHMSIEADVEKIDLFYERSRPTLKATKAREKGGVWISNLKSLSRS